MRPSRSAAIGRLPTPLLLALLALAACSDSPMAPGGEGGWAPLAPSGPSLTQGAGSRHLPAGIAALLEGAHSFLAPLPKSEVAGPFDPSALSHLTLEVCGPEDCEGTSRGIYTAHTGPGGATLRLDAEDEHFIVNWRPSDLGLPSPAFYRLRVAVAGLVLGHTDVYLASNGGDLRRADTGEAMALLDRQTLPVRFTVQRNAVVAAWTAAAGGGTTGAIADLLVEEFGLSASEVVAVLAFLGRPAAEVVDVLVERFDLSAQELMALLLEQDLVEGAGDATDLLLGTGFTLVEVVEALEVAFDLAQEEVVELLREAGVDAFDVAAAFLALLGEAPAQGDLEAVAELLGAGGFDAEAVFGAIYRVGTELLSDPVDFALQVALAVMRGVGYALDDFRAALTGVADWTNEQLIDGLGLSGYSLGEIVPFALDILGLTVETVMVHAAGWGASLGELVEALVEAGAAVEEIVEGAVAAFDAAAEAIGQALAEAGVAAREIADAFVDVLGQGLDEVAATLRDLGYDPHVIFDAMYDVGLRILDEPVEFVLGVALATMRGAGFTLGSFRNPLQTRISEWTQDQLIDGLGLSGFELEDLASFALDVMGLTVDRVAAAAQRWGATAQDFAEAMLALGAPLEKVGDALMEVFGLGLEGAARILDRAGFVFETLADWVWERTGRLAGATAGILRRVGASAEKVTSFLVHRVGVTARSAFDALKDGGYAAVDAVRAVRSMVGTSFKTLASWIRDGYGLGVEATLGILQETGATLSDLVAVILEVFELTVDEAVGLLEALGHSLADILAELGL